MKRVFENDEKSHEIAIEYLKQGKVIAFATDTVYGLAVDGVNESAVDRIYELKKRNKNKPIAIFLPSIKIAKSVFEFSKLSEKIVEKFMPGPLTLVVKKLKNDSLKIAKNVNENDDFLGFRIIKSDFLTKVFAEFDGVLAVTSANVSSQKDSICADDVAGFFADEDILLVDGGICKEKVASTVIKVDGDDFEILREGAIKTNVIKNEVYN